MTELLQLLYDSEAAWSIESQCWDAGVTVKLFANCTDKALWEGHNQNVVKAVQMLALQIADSSPDSEFAKQLRSVMLDVTSQINNEVDGRRAK